MKDDDIESAQPPAAALAAADEEQTVLKHVAGNDWAKYARVAMAALSGLPWVGSVIGAAGTYASENAQQSSYRAMYFWVKIHQEKLREVTEALQGMFERFESFGDRIKDRVESEEYLSLVSKTFHQWDHTETAEKKEMLKRLITNAGGIEMAQDELVRMFLDWIDDYHEFHFAVIGEIYKNPGITRRGIWEHLRGAIPRDDSEEADLFRLLIRDLSTGGVVRQERQTDYQGRFLKQQSHRGGGSGSSVMESAFESAKRYELTALGKQFVHYVLTDLATPLGGGA